MANTNELKNVVEPALLERFFRSENAQQVVPSLALKRQLLGMEFDAIGIQRDKRTLLFCESTVSGFLGHSGKDFHIGATRKFADTFARFSIVRHSSLCDDLLKAGSEAYGVNLVSIACHLVVPKGTRFIRALGYRTKLLGMGVMKLSEIELPADVMEILERVLGSASAEMRA